MRGERESRERIVREAEAFAVAELSQDRTGHDAEHVRRVARMAARLAAEEGADADVCAVAAWLHDVADEKLNESKESGLRRVEEWLRRQPMAEQDQAHILEIIATMSYNAGANPPMRTLEGKVVQDADRLDAVGAIGIARTFVYAGWRGDLMYDPKLPPRGSMTPEEYRRGPSTAINHFHEKLLQLKDRMNTATARRIAEDRHAYMERYLERFLREWEGLD